MDLVKNICRFPTQRATFEVFKKITTVQNDVYLIIN